MYMKQDNLMFYVLDYNNRHKQSELDVGCTDNIMYHPRMDNWNHPQIDDDSCFLFACLFVCLLVCLLVGLFVFFSVLLILYKTKYGVIGTSCDNHSNMDIINGVFMEPDQYL